MSCNKNAQRRGSPARFKVKPPVRERGPRISSLGIDLHILQLTARKRTFPCEDQGLSTSESRRPEQAFTRDRSTYTAMYRTGEEASMQCPIPEPQRKLEDQACLCQGSFQNPYKVRDPKVLYYANVEAWDQARAKSPSMPSSGTYLRILWYNVLKRKLQCHYQRPKLGFTRDNLRRSAMYSSREEAPRQGLGSWVCLDQEQRHKPMMHRIGDDAPARATGLNIPPEAILLQNSYYFLWLYTSENQQIEIGWSCKVQGPEPQRGS